MKEQDLIRAMGTVNLGKKAENEILNKTLNCLHEKEYQIMPKKRICVTAAAAILAISTVAYAATGIITSWSGASSSIPEYTSFPSSQQITEDIGYAPKMVESFRNGYNFDSADIVDNSLNDDSGDSVEKFKSISVGYTKGQDEVIFSADKFNSEMELSGDMLTAINGIPLYYSSYSNKLVPPDYELTDADKKAEESGELVFSYGSDQVSISQVQGLVWEEDGIRYGFTQIDGALSAEELVEMAEEIIRK